MAELGLVTLATVARRVGQAGLPASRRQCSTPQLTPPQLLAMLGLRRDADGTVREAEVRGAEPRERRAAWGLHRVPDDTTVSRVLRRLNAASPGPLMSAVVARLMPRLARPRRERSRRPGSPLGRSGPSSSREPQIGNRGSPGAPGCSGPGPWLATTA